MGVSVFGSAVIRVAPDTAVITMSVSRMEKEPKDAFAKARQGSHSVQAFLQANELKEFGASRITLSQERQYTDNKPKALGYTAKIGYTIVLRDLDRVDDILAGLIAAGANELASVTFQTSRLKEVRAEARKRAVVAAREKAIIYCEAAGVSVGAVVSLEDVNPETLTGRYEGHTRVEIAADDQDAKTIDPGAISVAAAVQIVYGTKEAEA